MKGFKEEKKPTSAQLERRLKNAIIHMDKTKDTKEVYFDDRGMRVVVNEDMAFISNSVYTTVFNRIYTNGETNHYLCLKNLVELAEKYQDKIIVKDDKGNTYRSYGLLNKVVEEKKDEGRTWLFIMDKWLYNYETNITLAPRADFDNVTFFVTYEKFIHSICCNKIIGGEHKEAMSNKEYLRAIANELLAIAENEKEQPMFVPLSDEEREKREMEAIKEIENEKILKQQAENNDNE